MPCRTIPACRRFFTDRWCSPATWAAEGLTEAHIIGPNLRVGAPNTEQFGSPLGPANTTPPVPEIEIPTFRASGEDPSSWIKPAGGPLTFRTTGQKNNVTLVPLNSLFDRRYSVYWQVS